MGRVLGRDCRHSVLVTSGDPTTWSTGPQWFPAPDAPPEGWAALTHDQRLEATATAGEHLVGLALAEAVAHATSKGYVARLVKKDDSEFVLTMDLNFRRINLEVDNGRVVSASAG
jgi:hypothetical protein